MRNLTLITLGLLICITSCQGNRNQETNTDLIDSISALDSTSVDSTLDEHAADPTLLVRENFNRINEIKNWDRIDSAEIHESTEGGIAKYYTKNSILELIKVRSFGEGGFSYQDFYLKDGKLSFIFEEVYNYNTHIIDPKFDISKTKKVDEVRYYFHGDSLFNLIATDKENEKYLKENKIETEKNMTKLFGTLMQIQANDYNPAGISE